MINFNAGKLAMFDIERNRLKQEVENLDVYLVEDGILTFRTTMIS